MQKDEMFEEYLIDHAVTLPGFYNGLDNNLKIDLVAKAKSIPECIIISLAGLIDTYNYKFFQKQVTFAIANGFSKVILDCDELIYVSSIGVGAFSALLNAAKQEGGGIVLLRPQYKVYEVFKVLGFSRYFSKTDTLEEAISLFSGPKHDAAQQTFPRVFPCPVCSKKLRVSQPGHFRCTGCQTILSVNKEGAVEA